MGTSRCHQVRGCQSPGGWTPCRNGVPLLKMHQEAAKLGARGEAVCEKGRGVNEGLSLLLGGSGCRAAPSPQELCGG